jgi:hypothetical protein
MVNLERRLGRLLYRETQEKQPFGELGRALREAASRAGCANNNKNTPRSEARSHMGLPTFVPAGIALSVARAQFSRLERRDLSRRRSMIDAVAGQ